MPARPFAALLVGAAAIVSGTTPAGAECGTAAHASSEILTAQETPPGRTYQVLITFAPDTPSERMDKVTRNLGVRIEQRMFGRIVVGSAPESTPLTRMKDAAKSYPEVLAVERSEIVRPQ
jgi:hypothetical protein